MLTMSEVLRGIVLRNPYFYIFLLHPPFILIGFYLLQRKCQKSRDFTWTVGICFVSSVLLLGASIGIGWVSCIRYQQYKDVLLEKVTAQYEKPPQELIDYYYADGGRNSGAFVFGGVYATIIVLIWSPLLLICWLIDRFLTRRKIKSKAPTASGSFAGGTRPTVCNS